MGNVLALAVLIALVGGSLVAWIWIELNMKDDCSSENNIQHLRYTEIDFGKVEVSWDPPEGGARDASIKYVITVSSIHTPIKSYKISTTTFILENMEPCITYNFIVEVKSENEYKNSSVQINISDVENLEPEDVEFNWTTNEIEWSAKYKYCICGFHLKVFHADVIIRDVILSESARKYEVSETSTCSWYTISIQTISKKSTRSPIVNKTIAPIFPITPTVSFTKNLGYKVFNSNTVVLHWDPTDMHRHCIKEFFIAVPDAGIYFSVPANITKASIASLKPCMEYLVSVMPFTTHKEIVGKIAEISVRTSTLENKIENLTFSEIGSTLYVKWTAPIVTSSCAEYYTLDICALDVNIKCRSFKPSPHIGNVGMSVAIPDAVACTVYKISLSVMKSNKLYDFHSEIYESKVRVLEAPILRNALDVKPTSANLEWGLQDLKKNRCPIYSVILECTSDGNSFLSYEFLTFRTAEPFRTNVQNLIPHLNYSCYATFNQHVFKSEKSAVVTFVTPEDVPSPVQNITMIKPRSNGFLLMWQRPASPNGLLKTYQVHVKHSRTLYTIPSWCPQRTRMSLKSILLAKDHVYNATGLQPYEEYIVSVSAATNVGFGKSQEVIMTTSPSTSHAVTGAQYSIISDFVYMVLWKQSCSSNGILKLFKVTVIGSRKVHPDDIFSYSVLPNTSFPDTEYSLKLPKLRPVYNYTIQISAKVEGVEEFGEIFYLNILTPASLPPVPLYEQLLGKMESEIINDHNGTWFKMTLRGDIFEEANGEILYYALIVGRDISINHKMESGSLNVFNEWPTMSNYEEASKYDFIFPYQVTPPYWNPFQSSSGRDESVDYVIGEDTVCETPIDGYCNGPLKPDTKYCLKIRAFTAAGYQDSPPLKFTTGSEIRTIIHANYMSAVCIFLFTFLVCGLYCLRTRSLPVVCLHMCSRSPLCEV